MTAATVRQIQPLPAVVVALPEAGARKAVTDYLTSLRWEVIQASGGAEALHKLETRNCEALLLGPWLPDLAIEEVIAQCRSSHPHVDLVMLDEDTVGGTRCLRRGELLLALRKAADANHDSRPSVTAAPAPAIVKPTIANGANGSAAIPELIGSSPQMQDLSRLIRLVAPRKTTVLIEGPTGSGKELVAQAIHRLSPRARQRMAVLNCAAIPESLLEAELFGHTRGAFTGAVSNRTGRIEAADGGTLFLDEIGEMPLALQSKLLRFLENGELQRVGDNEPIKVDVRVIAATHQPLALRAQEGLFRSDLYYRLAVFPLRTPALREHLEDVPRLAQHFLRSLTADSPAKTLSEEVLSILAAHDYPGNVRELQHVIERACILSEDAPVIAPSHLLLN